MLQMVTINIPQKNFSRKNFYALRKNNASRTYFFQKKKGRRKKALVQILYTFKTKSVMETDKYLAILATTIIHFPRPDWRGLRDGSLRDLAFGVLLFEGLITTSMSHINTCSLGSLEIKPNSLTKDWRKLSLISPTETDSIAPCKIIKVVKRWISSLYRH